MKISFTLGQESLELELSLEKYKKLRQLINESSSEEEALCFCDALPEGQANCHQLIAYEFAQKKHRERVPTEFDTVCDYDDHL